MVEQLPDSKSEKPELFPTLDSLQEHFIHLYGRRNTIYLPGRIPRINFLNVAIGDLQDAVRKNSESDHLQAMLARIVARTFAVANGINDISLAKAMAEKYPEQGCVYCRQNPCQCEENRPDASLSGITSPDQLTWSLKNWQEHLGNLYGAKNEERGIVNVVNRLFKEVSELMTAEYGIKTRNSLEEVEQEFALELADTLAWTIAAANLLEIDLEKSTAKRYGQGCWACKQNPCMCKDFDFQQIRVS